MNEFWKYTMLFLLVEFIVFVAASSLQVLPMSFLVQQFQQVEESISNSTLVNFLAIYSNNVRIDLASSVPFIGPVILLVTIFITGQVVYAVAVSSFSSILPGGLVGFLTSVLLFLMPHGVVELLSYALAASDSVMVVKLYYRGYNGNVILRYFVAFLTLSLVNLAVAAALEASELSIAQVTLQESILGTEKVYALWVVAAPYLVALYFAQKRLEARLLGGHTGGSDRSPSDLGPQPS